MAQNIYKSAAITKLRIQTTRGPLPAEQLYDLDLQELDDLAVRLEKEYQESGTKSFIDKSRPAKNKEAKLKFDIVLDVIETKMKADEAESTRLENKAHNENIQRLIKQKEQGQLEEMSIEELKSLLKK